MTTFSGIAGSSCEEFKETRMSMYLQDFIAGPNFTDIPVAGVAGKLWSFSQFGTVYVTDDPLTQGPSLHAPSVGRAQGVFVAAALDGLNAHIVFSVRFTNKEYIGSTLGIQGNSILREPVRELSVVSGTGKFRFARGYATCETYSVDSSIGYAVVRFNVTVEHK
ncbi:hypothetical protein ACLB2K_062202 [Fragaria x ananassa]